MERWDTLLDGEWDNDLVHLEDEFRAKTGVFEMEEYVAQEGDIRITRARPQFNFQKYEAGEWHFLFSLQEGVERWLATGGYTCIASVGSLAAPCGYHRQLK